MATVKRSLTHYYKHSNCIIIYIVYIIICFAGPVLCLYSAVTAGQIYSMINASMEEYLNGHNAAVEAQLSCGDGSEATLANICRLCVHGCHASLILVNGTKPHFISNS